MSTAPPTTLPHDAVDPEHPWLGLCSFTEDTRAYFFGRDEEVTDLFERVVHKPLTVLFGQSGLGKTSLLQAALLPRLRENGYLPVLVRLDHAPDAPSPERQLLAALRAALLAAGYADLARFPEDVESLWLLLHDPQHGFVPAHGAASPLPVSAFPLPTFLFDQFEEIFTLGERPERRDASRAFLDALAGLVENRPSAALGARLETDDDLAERLNFSARPAKVLLTLREDFLHVLERWRRQMPSLMDNRLELRLLTGPQALEAVVKPGQKRGAGRPPIVSEETGAAIVRFVAGQKEDVPLPEIDAVPPLLSLICAELNARRLGAGGENEGEETIRTEQLQGQSADILEGFYRDCFAGVPVAVRELVEDRLLSADGFRESLALDTAHRVLETAGVAPAEAHAAIGALVDRRLLVVEERGGVRRMELTHDVLTGVARASRDQRAEREAAERADRERAVLAAEAAEQHRQIRRARLRVVVMTLLAGASLVMCVVAWGLREVAEGEKRRAEQEKGRAVEASERAEAEKGRAEQEKGRALTESKRAEEQKQRAEAALLMTQPLRQAFLSDLATGRSFAAGGNWREALAYFHRAQDYQMPDRGRADAGLWSEIVYGHGERDALPQYLLRHESAVHSAAYSPDGTRLVTACLDGTARQWEAATGQPIGEPLRHDLGVNGAAYSPDGKRIVTTGEDKTARQWEAATGQPIGEPLRHEGAVWSAAYSPDGTRLVTAGEDKTARQWDAASGQPIGEPLHRQVEPNTSARIRRAPSRSGVSLHHTKESVSNTVHNARSLTKVGGSENFSSSNVAYGGDGEIITSAAYSPNGKRIVITSNHGQVQQCDAATGQPIGEPMRHEGAVWSAAYSPDGTRLVTAGEDKTARQWEAASGQPVGEPLRHDVGVNGAAYSPDGTRLVTACGDGAARQWDAASGRALTTILRHEGAVWSAAYSPDGTRLVTAGEDKTAGQWDAATGRVAGEPLRHEERVLRILFNPAGTRLVTACLNGTAQQWEAATGQTVGESLEHDGEVRSAAYSPDGTRLVTACLDGTARQWEAATGQPIGEPLRHDLGVNGAAYSPDGKRIVTTGEDKTARQWEAATGQPIGEPLRHEGAVLGAAYSPDGTRLVTACGDGAARQWEAATGQPIGEPLRHLSGVNSADYSPDGKRVITASLDGIARQWDAATGQPIHAPLRHEGAVWSAAYSSDGTRMVTASLDGTAGQWDASGRLLGVPLRHEEVVYGATYSPDGKRILTACGDKTARQWDCLMPTDESPPRWLDQFVQALSGLRFGDDGELEPIGVSQRLALREAVQKQLADAAGPQDASRGWEQLAHWALAPARERLFTPNSRQSTAEIAAREREVGGQANVEASLRLVPDLPLTRLALAGFTDYEKQADFLRRYELKRLPAGNATLQARAAAMLREQKHPQLALQSAEKAVAADAKHAGARRQLAGSLADLKRPAEALAAYEALFALPDAELYDFTDAGEFAADQRQGERARSLFRRSQERFPKEPRVSRLEGVALLKLNAPPAEALAVLARYEPLLAETAPGVAPHQTYFVALAVARWRGGDKDGATAACQRLIAAVSGYADAAQVKASDWPGVIKNPLLAALAETLRRHPELAPKK